MNFSSIISSKKIAFVIVTNLILTLGLLFYHIYDITKANKDIVFINNAVVFEKFKMSIDMKKLGEKEINYKKQKVDSLYKLLNNPDHSYAKENIMKEFVFEKENLEDFARRYAEEESLKIWARIHAYTKDFSKEKGYEIVLGTQNGENVIFGSEEKNVSDELIEYINNKYEGNK